MRLWTHAKNFKAPSEVSASFHANISRGYYSVDEKGNKTFIPYDTNEMGELHSFLSPGKDHYKHMKWNKTKDWKDKEKAKKSKWTKTEISGGLNTISK
jgi:hypothetical protein